MFSNFVFQFHNNINPFFSIDISIGRGLLVVTSLEQVNAEFCTTSSMYPLYRAILTYDSNVCPRIINVGIYYLKYIKTYSQLSPDNKAVHLVMYKLESLSLHLLKRDAVDFGDNERSKYIKF